MHVSRSTESKQPARSRAGRSCNVQPVTWNGVYAAKLANAFPTSPSRSRLSARSRSWRTRSRVTPSMPPISSSVCSRPPSNPKYRRNTLASRRCNVFSACSISSDRKRSIAWSSVSGRSSAMKRSISERSPSGSSGASSRTSPVLSAASDCTTSSDILVGSEISSRVGSRRSVCRRNSAVRTIRDRSAERVNGTRTVRPSRERGEDRLADPPHGVRDELHALVRVELPGRREQPDVPLADQVGKGQATVLVLLGDRDHEAQVALHQLLHRLLVAGAHLPGERDLLLLSKEGRLGHLVEILVEDVALVLMGPEAGEQTPTAPALLNGLRLRLGGRRHGGGRDWASRRAGLRPGGGGGLLPSDVLGHVYSPGSPCDTGHRSKSSR